MHFQENTFFDHSLGVNVTGHVAQYPLYHICDLCTCKVGSCYAQLFRRRFIFKKIYSLTLGSRSHKILTHAAAKFEVTTSNRLMGDAFTEN